MKCLIVFMALLALGAAAYLPEQEVAPKEEHFQEPAVPSTAAFYPSYHYPYMYNHFNYFPYNYNPRGYFNYYPYYHPYRAAAPYTGHGHGFLYLGEFEGRFCILWKFIFKSTLLYQDTIYVPGQKYPRVSFLV